MTAPNDPRTSCEAHAPPPITIDRCVCGERTFASIVAEARQRNVSGMVIWREITGGRGCGLCRRYLCKAVETGQTVFHELL